MAICTFTISFAINEGAIKVRIRTCEFIAYVVQALIFYLYNFFV